jgi:hypothetical protein
VTKPVRKTVRRKETTLAQAQLTARIAFDIYENMRSAASRRRVVRRIAAFGHILDELIGAIEQDDEKRVKNCITRLVRAGT